MSIRVTKTALATLALILTSLELTSWAVLVMIEKRWQSVADISARQGVDHAVLAREMEDLYYVGARYHPARWYALPADYRGSYVRTDAYGFRIDRDAVLEKTEKIALFGGSTMFSTTTRQEGTIAHALSRLMDGSKVGVMNYGVGGYSTSAEMPTLIEATRIDDGIQVAVFYDGVNEVGRYLELLQDRRAEAFFPIIGYPFDKTLRVALDNAAGGSWLPYRLRMLILGDFILTYGRKLVGQRSLAEQSSAEEVESMARRIADLYVANVLILDAVARSKGITPVFMWQPDIFLTKKQLTPRETQVRDSRPAMLKALTLAVHRLLPSDRRLKQLVFIDISDALDGLAGEHFFDYCHVSEEANAVIAARMAVVLRDALPAGLIRFAASGT